MNNQTAQAQIYVLPRQLDDGSKSRWLALLVRYELDGRPAYRHPTPDEELEYMSQEAW